jgi:membrane-bound lytic murein transglycosylase D
MQKSFFAFLLSICLTALFVSNLNAQNSYKINIKRAKLPDHDYLLSDFSLDTLIEKGDRPNTNFTAQELSERQKDILGRINEIYKIHIKTVSDEINNDPVSAEKHIMTSLRAIHKFIQDYPEIKNNDRFKELYRTVYTEYSEFYGIDRSKEHVRGKVFALRKEFLNSKGDWMKGQYVLPKDVIKPKSEVPLIYNKHVNQHLAFFTQSHPEVMEKWIKRSEKYFPMMKKIFRKEGVPVELVHLSMIESGLNPFARSWASAVGMWQFIRPTAERWGLEVNWWVDERRDPVKATRAAARMLKHLYGVWDNWDLAMANYNCSTHGIKRAIREAGGEADYWAAYPYLPRETQGYVPGFIATTIIDRNAKDFGFQKNYQVDPYSYDTVEVAPLMPLKKLAKAAGITTKKLKQYNPELLRWATPPGSKYSLKIPEGTKGMFAANYSKIPKDKRSKGVAVHTVRRGETLGYIAGKYGSTVHAIFAANKGLSSTIYPGQKIVVPLAPGSSHKIAAKKHSSGSAHRSTGHHSSKSRNGMAAVTYKVKQGDTIGAIAEWYDVRASQIRAWNHTSNAIHPGDRLTIHIPENKKDYYRMVTTFSRAKKKKFEREQHNGVDITQMYLSDSGSSGTVNYVVRNHDTLSQIAQKFGVSVSDIKRANNLRSSRIHVGQKLHIVNGAINYVVQKHDTLIGIANSFGVSVNDIKQANNLHSSLIHVGQQLLINKN